MTGILSRRTRRDRMGWERAFFGLGGPEQGFSALSVFAGKERVRYQAGQGKASRAEAKGGIAWRNSA